MTERNEKKYQFIKLVQSGRTLKEVKALMKATEGGLSDEYVSSKDKQDLIDLEGGLHRIAMTRGQAKQIMKIKFGPRKSYPSTKEEVIARWASNSDATRLPINWARDGNLIRKGRPNKPKPGSSKSKIGRTSVTGADKVLKDFRELVKTLQALKKKYGKDNPDALRKAYKSFRTSVTAKPRS